MVSFLSVEAVISAPVCAQGSGIDTPHYTMMCPNQTCQIQQRTWGQVAGSLKNLLHPLECLLRSVRQGPLDEDVA